MDLHLIGKFEVSEGESFSAEVSNPDGSTAIVIKGKHEILSPNFIDDCVFTLSQFPCFFS